MSKKRPDKKRPVTTATAEQTEPDYTRKCEVCGSTPILPLTGMCGPCTFGESDTIDGNW